MKNTRKKLSDDDALRKRAESKLEQSKSESTQSLEVVNDFKLLPELQVHQIGPEMQQEELQKLESGLEKSNKKYIGLFDFTPNSYFELDSQGHIKTVSLTGAKLLGFKRNNLINRLFSRFINPSDDEIYQRCILNLVKTMEHQVCEVRILKPAGERLFVRLDISVIEKTNDVQYFVVATDITTQKLIDDTQSYLLGCRWSKSGRDFFEDMAEYLSNTLAMDYVCIDRLLEKGLFAQTVAIYYDGHFEDNVRYALKDTPCGQVVGQSVCCFPKKVRDLFPQDTILQEMAAESYVGITLWGSDGTPVGLIAVIGRKPLVDSKMAEIVLKQVSIRAAGELDFRKADELLRESEKAYKTLAENMPDLVTRFDSQLRQLYVNAAAAVIGRLSLSESENYQAGNYSEAEKGNTRLKKQILKVFKTANPVEIEDSFKTPEGLRYFDTRLVPEFDEEGQVVTVLSVARDITERKQTENTLIQSEERIRTITENAPDIIVELDQQGNILYMSRVLTGCQMEDVIGANFCDWVLPEYHKLMMKALKQVFRENSPQDFQVKGFGSNGETRWYQSRLSPVIVTGQVKSAIMITRDITERIQIEEALKENDRLLRESQTLAHIGSYSIDLIEHNWKGSPEIYNIFGIDDTFPHTLEGWIMAMHPEYRENVSSYLLKADTEKRRFDQEYKIIRVNDGSERWVHGLGILEFDNQMKPVRMIGTVQDITDQKQAEQTLLSSENRFRNLAEAAFEGLLVHSDGIILDINTVLTNMVGFQREEILGKLIMDFVPPEYHKFIFRRIKGPFEIELFHRNGSRIPVEVQEKPFDDANHLVVAVRDITASKKARNALHEAHMRTSTILEGIADTFYSLDNQWRFTMVNPAAERAPFGRPAAELIGKVIWDVYPNLVGTEIYSHYLEAAKNTGMEHYIAQSPLNMRWYEVFMQGIKSGVDVYMRDITGRKSAEDETQNLLKIVQEEKDKLASLVNSMSDEVWFADINNNLEIINPSALADYGIDCNNPNEVRKFINELEVFHPDGSPRPVKESPHLRALNGEMIKNHEEIIKIPASGQFRNRDVSATPVRDANDNIIGSISVVRDVTQRKLVETALKESETRFRLSLKNAPVTVAAQDRNLRFIWAYNQRTIKPEEVIGKTDTDIFDARDAAQLMELKHLVMETGTDLRRQLWITSNGKKLFLDLYLEPLRDSSGNITGVGIATVDLTQMKIAEEALRQSEEKFKIIATNTPDHILVQDADLRYEQVINPQIGLTEKEMIGKKDIEIITAENAIDLTKIKRGVLESGLPADIQTPLLAKDGTTQYFEGTYIPRLDSEGKVNGIIGYFRNVTEQKKSELALRESEATLLGILNAVTESIWLFNVDGVALLGNKTALARFGISPKTIIGKSGFNFLPPDLATSRMAKILEVVRTGRRLTFEDERAGISYENSFYPVQGLHGNIDRVAIFSRDITDRKKWEENLYRLNRMLTILGKSSQILLKSLDEAAYLEQVCRIVVEDCGLAMVWIGYAEDDESKSIRPVASAGFDEGYLETMNLTWADTERGRGPTGTAIRTGKMSMCRNMIDDPAFEPWRAQALKRGYASSIVFPLMDDKKAFGALTIYARKPDAFTEDEIQLLSELTNDLAHGITSIRLRAAHLRAEKALNKSYNELEVLVKERTDELQKTNELLRNEISVRIKAENVLIESQKYLRALTQRMDAIAEEERTHIAREIHDELGHLLTAIKYDIAGLMNKSDLSSKAVRRELYSVLSMVDSLIDTVRKISSELRPGILDHLGLFPAIEWQIRQFQMRTRISCEYNIRELDISFDKNETTIIFRILQEILTNVARHSKATKVLITVNKEHNLFFLTVADNGIGFELNKTSFTESLGLMGMRERALSIGAEIEIDSAKGKGTTITFLLRKN